MHTSCGEDIRAEAAQMAVPGSKCGHDSMLAETVFEMAQNLQLQLDHAEAV